MKALIIGGAGFIGSHIAEELLHDGLDVVVIDNLSSGKTKWIPSAATFYKMDMFDNDLEEVFAMERPDYVFHQAAQISVAKSMTAPAEDARMNILGTINVLQCAIAYNVKRFIFASSAAVYGAPEILPLVEDQDLHPTSFYGMSKAFAEEYIRLFSSLRQLDYSIFRYANVYGPRQDTEGEAGVIAVFLDKLFAGDPLTIYGDGSQTRDFVHVKDVARACAMSIKLEESTVINLSACESTSINALVDTMMKVTGIHSMVQKLPAKNGDILHSYLDNSVARAKLGWTPKISLEQGLLETFNHIAANRKVRSGTV